MPAEVANNSGKGTLSGRRRPRSPRWAKLLVTAGAVLSVFSFGGIVTARYFLGQLTGNIQTTTTVLGGAAGARGGVASKLPAGAMNLLLLGLDTRASWDAQGLGSRSDTIIVVHITAAHDKAYMISIPRDTIAHIPADKSIGFGGDTTKINSAYETGSANGRGWVGGAKLATNAVHELTGIGFDGVAVIDFDGFSGIIEAMGGLNLCVDQDMWSSHYTIDSAGKVHYAVNADPSSPPRNAFWFRKGCRGMAPWEALEYSRLRHSTNGDYDRQRHQQQLLRAMAKKATSTGVITNPVKVKNVLAAAGSSLKMDTHVVDITDFIFGLKGLAGANLIPVKSNGGTFDTQGSGEGTTADTRQLFAAAAADKMAEFLAAHPKLVISDTAGQA